MQEQQQLASGSTLPSQQTDGFLLLIRQLSQYRNRNSRNIGEQFRQFPAPEKVPEYYHKDDGHRRCLDMVTEALQSRRYTDPSQVYSDLYWSFHGVAEVAGKSSVTYRDARKMETMLDELWTKNKTLPPLSSLDPAVRPAPRAMSLDAMGDESMSADTSAHPSPAPQLSTDRLHGSMSPAPSVIAQAIPNMPMHRAAQSFSFTSAQQFNVPSPAQSPALAPLYAQSPSVLQQPTGTASPGPLVQSAQAHHQLQRTAPQQSQFVHAQYMQQMHYANPLSIFYPVPSGEQGVEIPVQLPPSVISNEAKKRLQEEQDTIFAARAKLYKGKKRNRDIDEVSDESSGWLEPRETGSAQKKFYLEVIGRLKAEKEPESGRSLSAPISNLPSHEKFPQFYQYIKDPHPPTLSSVEKHIRTNLVPDSTDFDAELCTVFANGRVWPAAGMNSSDGEALPPFYGDTLALQRLYQEMTKGKGSVPGAEIQIASLASVPYGPGSIPLEVEEIAEGQTRLKLTMSTNRIPTSQKTFLESIHYKGEDYAPGDFIHLFNPSNPKLPIIAQVFKCYRKNETGDRYLTVNWYYRPSQTSHPEDRTFYEQEVFKSSLFIDHKLEDLLERISVMHISDYTKGRFDYWDEDMPLYVVEHRWNIETNSFSKIKNWSLCIPEDSAPDPLSFRPFLDNAPPPNRIKSPFFRDSGITEPGRPGDSLVYEADEQLAYYTPLKNWPEGTGGLTGYAKKMLTKRLADPIVPSQHADTREQDSLPVQKRGKQARTESPAIVEISGDAAPTKETFAPTTDIERAALLERFDPLPESIKSHFRTDPKTHEMLWFPAPPLEIKDGARKKPLHSLDYLAHMARKLGYY